MIPLILVEGRKEHPTYVIFPFLCMWQCHLWRACMFCVSLACSTSKVNVCFTTGSVKIHLLSFLSYAICISKEFCLNLVPLISVKNLPGLSVRVAQFLHILPYLYESLYKAQMEIPFGRTRALAARQLSTADHFSLTPRRVSATMRWTSVWRKGESCENGASL
jgi:hypothetical protein